MPYDFSKLDSKAASEAGTVIDIISPASGDPLIDDETGKPVTITILGVDSPKLRNIARKLNDRRMNDARRGKNNDYDSEVAEAEQIKLLAAATIAWEGIALDSKEPLECNEKNAVRFYSDPRFPWLKEQIDRAISDRQRFFKKASPSS